MFVFLGWSGFGRERMVEASGGDRVETGAMIALGSATRPATPSIFTAANGLRPLGDVHSARKF